MKTNKKIYYVVISIIAAGGLFFLWRAYSKPAEIKPDTQPQNQTANKNAGENTQIYFASNGKTKVYKIKKDDKWSVIWNGKEGKSYDYVSNPVFSPDGTQLAYSAELDGQSWVVLNNEQEFFAYRKAASITFSPDGKKLAFVAIKESTSIVVINGQESRDYETVRNFETPSGTTSIIFSPDGQQIIYVITEGGQSYIVINGQEGQPFDSITEVYFNENNELVYEAQRGDNVVTVIDNQVVSTQTNTDSQTPDENSADESSENSSDGSIPNKPYRYKISTQKDINLEDDDSINYGTCQPGASCNF